MFLKFNIVATAILISLSSALSFDTRTRVDELLPKNTCPLMTVSTTCESYYYAIYDGNRSAVFSGYFNGTDYSSCYNIDECYSVQFISLQEDCVYNITMDEAEINGTIVFDPSYAPNEIIFVGNCTNNFEGGQELYVYSHPALSTGDIAYALYRFGQSEESLTFPSENGTIQNGKYDIFHMSDSDCNIFTSRIEGSGTYFLVQGNETIDSGVLSSTQYEAFGGSCATNNCLDETIIMKNDNKDPFSYNLSDENGEIRDSGDVVTIESICIDVSKCNILTGNDTATYFFLRDNEVYDIGLSTDYYGIGACKKECDLIPLLSNSSRGLDIVTHLATISGMNALVDVTTSQYKTACWLIYDDVKKLNASSTNLVQRYVLGLLYTSTNGPGWYRSDSFLSGKDECNWVAVACSNKRVSRIILSNNNLNGTLVSELYALSHLEAVDMSLNYLFGTVPYGLSRLRNLSSILLYLNSLNGTLPDDFFSDSLQIISISLNQFSGSIPKFYTDRSELRYADFSYNMFSGTFPQWFSNITALTYLNLDNNQLKGSIPNSIEKLQNLESLRVGNNFLTGIFPHHLFMLHNLREIRLLNNEIQGTLPNNILESILSKSKLNTLELSNNSLTGSFPQSFTNLINLNELDVQDNDITGTIPPQLCKQTNIAATCGIGTNLTCECCKCEDIFTYDDEILECSNQLIFNVSSQFRDYITLTLISDSEDETILYDSHINTENTNYIRTVCISSTDCYRLTSEMSRNSDSNEPAMLDLIFNNDTIIENLTVPSEVKFGYRKNETLTQNYCDSYSICDMEIEYGSSERKALNMITKFEDIIILENSTTPQHKAICWLLKETVDEIVDSSIIQRYILAVIYFSTNGKQWENDSGWRIEKNECEWYGIECKIFDGVVSGLNLTANNLEGTLPTEIGELKGLDYIDLGSNRLKGFFPVEIAKLQNVRRINLSKNNFQGNIPSEIRHVKVLNELFLSSNQFTGTIPSEVGNLNKIKIMDLSHNSFTGDVDDVIYSLTALTNLNVSNNLFRGKVRKLKNTKHLVLLDLSNNYFTGDLPLFGNNTHGRLSRIHLNNNRFSSSIPTVVGEMGSLKDLFLHKNEVIGTIPSEIGDLKSISRLSMSYNQLKGNIPPSIKKLIKLKLFHLHGNQLEGNADKFTEGYVPGSFISDCGKSDIEEQLVDCKTCSECCNEDGGCITLANTWPDDNLESLKFNNDIDPFWFIILLVLVCWIILLFVSFVMSRTKENLPSMNYRFEEFQQDSIYRFFLGSNKFGIFIAISTTLFQIATTYIFFIAGDINSPTNDWTYRVSCPYDSIECTDQDQRTLLGWFFLSIILLIFALPDIIDGVFIYYHSTITRDMQGKLTGLTLLSVSAITVVAQVIYLYANSVSNPGLLKDSVAILFLNEVDEQVFQIVRRLVPSWVEKLEEDVENYDSNSGDTSNVANNANDGDSNLELVQPIIDVASTTSRVEATSHLLRAGRNYDHDDSGSGENLGETREPMPQDVSMMFCHVENLNSQIRELHRIIEDLRQSKDRDITNVRNEVRFVKTFICV